MSRVAFLRKVSGLDRCQYAHWQCFEIPNGCICVCRAEARDIRTGTWLGMKESRSEAAFASRFPGREAAIHRIPQMARI